MVLAAAVLLLGVVALGDGNDDTATQATAAPTSLEPPPTATSTPPTRPAADCHPSYPDFCIPGAPPDLDCADVGGNDFRVRPPDPHGFDREGDGLGCES